LLLASGGLAPVGRGGLPLLPLRLERRFHDDGGGAPRGGRRRGARGGAAACAAALLLERRARSAIRAIHRRRGRRIGPVWGRLVASLKLHDPSPPCKHDSGC
jgi:hypothetical protein